jgi:hypothetical protein
VGFRDFAPPWAAVASRTPMEEEAMSMLYLLVITAVIVCDAAT